MRGNPWNSKCSPRTAPWNSKRPSTWPRMRDNASGRKVGIRGRVPLVPVRLPERHSGDSCSREGGVAPDSGV